MLLTGEEKGADGFQHSTKTTLSSDHMEQVCLYFRARWKETCRLQLESHLCEWTVSKMHLLGMHPFCFFISACPVYSQPRSLSEAGSLCLFSCSRIQFHTQCHIYCKYDSLYLIFVFFFSLRRVKGYNEWPVYLQRFGAGSEQKQLGTIHWIWHTTRPRGVGVYRLTVSHRDFETMFVFTKRFRGKISPVWAWGGEYL